MADFHVFPGSHTTNVRDPRTDPRKGDTFREPGTGYERTFDCWCAPSSGGGYSMGGGRESHARYHTASRRVRYAEAARWLAWAAKAEITHQRPEPDAPSGEERWLGCRRMDRSRYSEAGSADFRWGVVRWTPQRACRTPGGVRLHLRDYTFEVDGIQTFQLPYGPGNPTARWCQAVYYGLLTAGLCSRDDLAFIWKNHTHRGGDQRGHLLILPGGAEE